MAVLLNGLGHTKYEELFVVYARVAERLRAAGLTVVDPEVGEHVTSLDMAGLSLSVTFLDPELERYWSAPADTPAFRRGAVEDHRMRTAGPAAGGEERPITTGEPASQALAGRVTAALRAMAAVAAEHERVLGDLDAVAGDGDHGQGMVLGSAAALRSAEAALAAGAGARTLLVRAGEAWSEGAGGTSGALWGAALTAAGAALSDADAAAPAELVAAVERGAEAVVRLGGAEPGDKTMVDALVPFTETLVLAQARGTTLAAAWREAADAATAAAAATSGIAARRGRARTHGDHSLGHADPGATSFALLMSAVADLLGEPSTTLAGAQS